MGQGIVPSCKLHVRVPQDTPVTMVIKGAPIIMSYNKHSCSTMVLRMAACINSVAPSGLGSEETDEPHSVTQHYINHYDDTMYNYTVVDL